MYTGSSLFKGLTVGQVFFMVVYEMHRPAIPEDCPEAFVKLMTACWSADPADRYCVCHVLFLEEVLSANEHASQLFRIQYTCSLFAYTSCIIAGMLH